MYRSASKITKMVIAIIAINSALAQKPENHKAEELNLQGYLRICDESKDYYVSNSSSEVIVRQNNQVKSFGNPIPHYALQGLQPFIFQKGLFAIGGYGFWRINPFLLEFDTTKGWNAYNLGPLYQPTIDAYTIVIGDTLILIGGKILGENLVDFLDCNKIQYIDLRKRKCTSSISIDQLSDAIVLGEKDEKILFQNKHGYYLIALRSQKIYNVEVNTKNIHLFENPRITKVSNNELIINNVSIPIRLFVKSNKYDTYLPILAFLAITLTALIFIYGYRHSVRKLTIKNINFPESKSHFIKIEIQELKIIEFLKTGPKLINDLLELYPEELSQSHKTKLIRETIHQINYKTNYLGGDLIIIRIDELDSRRKVFILNESLKINYLLP
jgi:hypothetical protein